MNRRTETPARADEPVDLAASRERIDAIDARIIELFEERMRVAADVAAYKRAKGLPVLDRAREARKVEAATQAASAEFARYMEPLFESIMEMSREYQQRLLDGEGCSSRVGQAQERTASVESLAAPGNAPGVSRCDGSPCRDEASASSCEGAGAPRVERVCGAQHGDAPVYGLLGRSLGHSYSPKIHALLGAYEYRLFEVEPEDVKEFVLHGRYDGINVTIPYKETVMPLCDELSDAARAIGCVNTLVRRADGTIYGDNTDYDGFSFMLDRAGVEAAGRKALVLGAGGASKTVCAVLRDRGAREVAVVSRGLPGAGFDTVERHYDADIVVNATPVGMYPHCPESIVDLEPFARTGETRAGYRDGLDAVLDVVYNPARTGILLQAEKLGVAHENGLSMLVAQAKRASEVFRGVRIDESAMERAIERVAADMRSVVLIGMPGGGKSTVGALVAARLGRPFVDVDERIAQRAGMPVPEIFERLGEAAFRRYETEAVREVCKESGLVAACGGGVVTQPRNYDLLHQNAVVVLLRRPLELLACEGRPVSKATGVAELFRRRAKLYEAWADAAVENDATLEDAVERVIAALEENETSEGRTCHA